MDGVEATRLICEADPSTRVLVLAQRRFDRRVRPGASKSGAVGFIRKEHSAVELAEATSRGRVTRARLQRHPAARRRAEPATSAGARFRRPWSRAQRLACVSVGAGPASDRCWRDGNFTVCSVTQRIRASWLLERPSATNWRISSFPRLVSEATVSLASWTRGSPFAAAERRPGRAGRPSARTFGGSRHRHHPGCARLEDVIRRAAPARERPPGFEQIVRPGPKGRSSRSPGALRATPRGCNRGLRQPALPRAHAGRNSSTSASALSGSWPVCPTTGLHTVSG